jgi:hypothetical protein
MNLTATERKTLDSLDRRHREGVPLSKTLLVIGVPWAIFAFCAATSYLTIVPEYPGPGWTAVGMFIGAALRDINMIRRSNRLWPILDRIIDWSKVADLLATETDEDC